MTFPLQPRLQSVKAVATQEAIFFLFCSSVLRILVRPLVDWWGERHKDSILFVKYEDMIEVIRYIKLQYNLHLSHIRPIPIHKAWPLA